MHVHTYMHPSHKDTHICTRICLGIQGYMYVCACIILAHMYIQIHTHILIHMYFDTLVGTQTTRSKARPVAITLSPVARHWPKKMFMVTMPDLDVAQRPSHSLCWPVGLES